MFAIMMMNGIEQRRKTNKHKLDRNASGFSNELKLSP